MNKLKILGICPYEGLGEIMANVAQRRSDIELSIFVGDLDAGVGIAEDMSGSYDGIISRGGTAELLRQKFSLPVIEIPISTYDVLHAIKLARDFSDQIAIVGFPAITNCARTLCDLLQYNIRIIPVKSAAEVPKALETLLELGCTTVLGDMITVTYSMQRGINGILIASGTESIHLAFDQAVQTCEVYNRIKREKDMLLRLMQSNPVSTTLLAEDGSLLFTSEAELPDNTVNLYKKHLVTALADGHANIMYSRQHDLLKISARKISFDAADAVCFYLQCLPQRQIMSDQGVAYYSKANNAQFDSYFGSSERINQVVESAARFAAMSRVILVLGEEGCGQDDIVFYMYLRGRRPDNPLVSLDCGKISDKLWEFLFTDQSSPLFAGDCSVYFRNIETLDKEREEFIRSWLGTAASQKCQVYFSFCQSNGSDNDCPLCGYLKREELCSVAILPPLRERRDDIPKLCAFYINGFNIEYGKQVLGLSSEATELMCAFHWPYNNAQLKRVIKDLVITAASSYISLSDTRQMLQAETNGALVTGSPQSVIDLSRPLQDITRQIAGMILAEENYNQTRTAKRLGISRSTLWRMLK